MKEQKMTNLFIYFKKPVCYTIVYKTNASTEDETLASNFTYDWKLLKYYHLQHSFGKQAIIILT